jgi:hypothetical protein
VSRVFVVHFNVEVSATARSVVQRSPTDGGVSFCVIYKSQEISGPGPRWAVAPEGNYTLVTRVLRLLLCIKTFQQKSVPFAGG